MLFTLFLRVLALSLWADTFVRPAHRIELKRESQRKKEEYVERERESGSPQWSQDPFKNIVAIVSSSPRKEDAGGKTLTLLQDTVLSYWRMLNGKAHVLVAFDGVAPDLQGKQAEIDYRRKIAAFREWLSESSLGMVEVWENGEWTHQAQMLSRVLKYLEDERNLTPIFFSGQDDSPVTGSVDVPFVVDTISKDRDINFVSLYWYKDCVPQLNWHGLGDLCTRTHLSGKLQNWGHYRDRPAFHRTDWFMATVVPKVTNETKKTPEEMLDSDKGWYSKYGHTLWVYGKRGDMLREANKLMNSNHIRGS
eukprot:TRINITY_DN5677_c0_g1_i1.p1 TRINITY_DN5677_c0_g1~~TRINITY_DN5677_c0_g1_i1.p1  ORF type:complete len:307 (+),score=26.14 TRINITY_DN5677_c0_g1_i1:83-1003(+)